MKKIVLLSLLLLLMLIAAPMSALAEDPVKCEQEYTVQAGDWLSKIAEKYFNDPLAYPAMVVLGNLAADDEYANIDNPDLIEPGWTICVPTEEDLPRLLSEAGPVMRAIGQVAGVTLPPTFQNTLWTLVASGKANDLVVVEPGTTVTAQFSDEGNVAGYGGCNNYNAGYELDGTDLSVGPAIGTAMACPTGMDQEQAYLANLQKAQSFDITLDGFLKITYKSGLLSSGELWFVEGQTDLQNTQWVLQSYGSLEEPKAVEAGTTLTAVFTGLPGAEEGTVVGFAGCNNYNGDYASVDGAVEIGPLASTRKFCAVGSDQEQAFLAGMQASTTAEILGSRLILSYPDGQLVFTSINLPVENILWALESYGAPGEQIPVGAEVDVTAYFTPVDPDADDAVEGVSGNVGGKAGCNTYNASYEKLGPQLTVGPAITTLMACPDDQMAVEQAFLAALDTVERAQALGNQLRVFYNNGESVLTFRADRTPLESTYWVLTGYGDVDVPQSPVEGSNITAVLQRQPGTPSGIISGQTGCNDYNATYAASFTNIKVNPASKGTETCGNGISDVENAYLAGLTDSDDYRIVGDTMQILYDDGAKALNFVASQPPPPPPTGRDLSSLNGTKWYLHSWANNAVLVGTEITAEFAINDDNITGVVSGSAGCNTYNANIDVNFVIGPAATTRKACEQPVMDQETSYLSALQTAYDFSQAGEQLLISTSAGVLAYKNTPPPPPALNPPTAVINGPSETIVGETVTFDGSGSLTESNITEYRWDFGDGTKATGAVVNHIYQDAGDFNVILQVVDDRDLTGETASMVKVNAPDAVGPTAVIEGPTEAFVGDEVTFNGGNSIAGTSPIVVYGWDFGKTVDAQRSGGDVLASTVYDAPGEYVVTLAVNDKDGLSDSASLTINIREKDVPTTPPTAVIDGPSAVTEGKEVTFSAANSQPGSSAIVGYAWDLGNGQTADSVDAVAVYAKPGQYQVSLTVTDEQGQSANASQTVDVSSALVGPMWLLGGALPDAPITAQFDGAVISGNSGCNGYGANYTASNGQITVSGFMPGTQIICSDAIMAQEQAYLQALQTATAYQISGTTLTLTSGVDQLIFYDERGPQPR